MRLRDLPGSGLANARRSAGALALVVAERNALTEALVEQPSPGGLTHLTAEQSWDLLARHRVGRLAYVARAGVLDLCPVNYVLHDGRLLLASGPGPKLQAAERGELVAFEVDDIDEADRTGSSVVVVAAASRLDEIAVRRLRIHGAELPEAWASGPRRSVISLRPVRITGRRLS